MVFLLLQAILLLVPCRGLCVEEAGVPSLSVILVPERNVFEIRSQYKLITDFLANKLGMPVSVQVAGNYSQAAAMLADGRVDAGFLSSFSYIAASRTSGVEPLARPLWADDRTTCRSYIFTRKEDALKPVSELAGRRLVLVDRASTVGFFFPVFFFRNSGVTSIEEHFEKIIYSHSHDVAVWSVFLGEADIGAAKDHVFLSLAREYPEILDRLAVIARSSNLPDICLAARPGLDPLLKERIQFLLLQMDKTAEGRKILAQFGALGFVRAADPEYDGLRGMLDEVRAEKGGLTFPRWME